jgi:fructose-1,6-bisphosphatase/inositol monophosphatase family enzyme
MDKRLSAMPSVTDLQNFKAVAEGIIRDTRRLITSRLSQGFAYSVKADGSYVTDIDTAVEDLIRSRIASVFPDHQILGEERGGNPISADYVWVIDPIDGTHSLKHGIPLFGTLLALRYRQRSVLGLIDLPLLNKTYTALADLGAECNGQPLHLWDVSSADAIQNEIIGIGERKQFVKCQQAAVFDTLMQSHGSVRTYCDCFGHALAIEGSLGAMVDYNLNLWDIAATELIIREAGGVLVRVNADSAGSDQGNRHNVVFGKPTVVRWILDTIGMEINL